MFCGYKLRVIKLNSSSINYKVSTLNIFRIMSHSNRNSIRTNTL